MRRVGKDLMFQLLDAARGSAAAGSALYSKTEVKTNRRLKKMEG